MQINLLFFGKEIFFSIFQKTPRVKMAFSLTISLTVFTFNCFTLSRNLFQKGFCTTVHVILIISFLLYTLNYNVFHLRTHCLFLMPPSTQQHSRKLIFCLLFFCDSISASTMTAMPFSIVGY